MATRARKKIGTSKRTNGKGAKASSRKPTQSEQQSANKVTNGTAGQMPNVHCMLAPMDEKSLLLPTQTVAEVIDYAVPEPVNDTPEWFLGQIEWESRSVPVFDYAALINGTAPQEVSDRSRIMIIKSLAETGRVPYLGMVIRNIPRLLSVEPPDLASTGDANKALGVFCHVDVGEAPAVIPDLERLTHLVTHVAYGALPITQLESA